MFESCDVPVGCVIVQEEDNNENHANQGCVIKILLVIINFSNI